MLRLTVKGFLRTYCVPDTVLTIGPCPQAALRENSGGIGPLGPKGADKTDAKRRIYFHSFTRFF